MDYFQRIKGAIDTRIAEEQARQRQQAVSASPQKPIPRRRPLEQNGTAPRTSSRQRQPANITNEKEPDPSDFEPEFAVGDDESAAPSRTGTPRPALERTLVASQPGKTESEESDRDVEARPPESNGSPAPANRQRELPQDVQARLKKLDRLETKYGELLKAYRIAHARVQIIEPFEASLREYTPLTTINDPNAFIEYLGQVSAKGDMILDEFKKVSAERDDFKKRAEQSEDAASQLRAEVTELKTRAEEKPAAQVVQQEATRPEAEPMHKPLEAAKEPTSPTASLKSPISATSRIPSFSLFSPRAKPTSPQPRESEDFFSYDSEVPKLETELRERQQQVEELRGQMNKLKGDLVVARESTEGMVGSLESATRELHELRDAKDKFDEMKTSLETRIKELENNAQFKAEGEQRVSEDFKKLEHERSNAEDQIESLRKQIEDLKQSKSVLEAQLESNRNETNMLNEKLGQKDSIVKDLEDTLAMMKSAERQAEQTRSQDESSSKKLGTMQGIMDNLRAQLDQAETTVKALKDEITANQQKFEAQPSSKVFGFLDMTAQSSLPELKTREDVVTYLASNFGLRKDTPASTTVTTPATSVAPSEAGTAQSSKKKNKKRKKGKGAQAAADEAEPEGPVKVSEDLANVDEGDDRPKTAASSAIAELEATIAALRAEIESKSAAIDRLSNKIKDQEALQEEIETLRDDLLHQGEEHVEARDRLKTADTERSRLRSKVEELEEELLDTKKQLAAGAASSASHAKSMEELEEHKAKSSSLQTDLSAAESLATSRFKDLTDLRDVLAKAQPELKALRLEVADLKSAKDDLKNKIGDLSRLEVRHEDLKSEMKGLGKRLGDKDSEIKELQQKIEQEITTRTRMEEEVQVSKSELRVAENKKTEAQNEQQQTSQDLKHTRQEAASLRGRLNELEDQISSHGRQVSELREQIDLKTQLHSSSQALVQSLRDETHELNTQSRESTSRAENLEEELAEAQRMLSERTREGQTMRMLLSQSEQGTEARVREMKERMDAAIEERDRVEDEASVGSRRMMREVDETKSKLRDAVREKKVVENEKEELEGRLKEWKRRVEEGQGEMDRRENEVGDVRVAMAGLREALNESERQVREMETRKGELRKVGDDAKERVEKLTKANKNLTEEVKALQDKAGVKKMRVAPGMDSGIQSSRTSLDSSRTRSPAPNAQNQLQRPNSRSETPTGQGGLSQGTVDYVYLKNVLLQFLEQKDKTHQRQLVPVIGMLLHFDRKDEQKWMSAITSR